MKNLKINDNSLLSPEQVAQTPRLLGKLANKPLRDLESEGVFIVQDALKESEDLDAENVVISHSRGEYRTSNLMGFIGFGDERLTIKSRFSNHTEDHFFRYLLARVFGLPNIVDLNTDLDHDGQVFEYLIFLFPRFLKQAMRKGLYKQYVTYQRNEATIRGTIDIARHIKENTPFTGKVEFNERQFSFDNVMMQLVRHTIEVISLKPNGKFLLAQVKDDVRLVREVTEPYRAYERRRVINQNTKRLLRHAYFREYASLQKLCLLILQQRKHFVGSGKREIYGVLFDGAWLWEEYVNSLISADYFHPRNKRSEGRHHLFSNNSGWIYPDFVSKDHANRIIADAKYKPIENIRNRDYLQILAYMYRFDARLGYFLYPEGGETRAHKLWLNKGSIYENNEKPRDDTFVIKHGLRIPQGAKDYESFVSLMKVSEAEFANALSIPV